MSQSSVGFRPAAQVDVRQATIWYGEERPRLALLFVESLDTVVERIRENPLQFPVVRQDIRRALLGRFPYGVFFVARSNHIDVLAVTHLHRHPDSWRRRK